MKHLAQARVFALRYVALCGGNPLPDVALRAAVREAYSHLSITDPELDTLLGALESDGFLVSTVRPLSGDKVWGITHKAKLALAES